MYRYCLFTLLFVFACTTNADSENRKKWELGTVAKTEKPAAKEV